HGFTAGRRDWRSGYWEGQGAAKGAFPACPWPVAGPLTESCQLLPAAASSRSGLSAKERKGAIREESRGYPGELASLAAPPAPRRRRRSGRSAAPQPSKEHRAATGTA